MTTEVRVPRAIARQAQEAAAIEAQLAATPPVATVQPEAAVQPAPPAPSPEQTSNQAPQQATPPAAPVESQRPDASAQVEHALRTLRGMFNAEVKQLRADTARTNDELRQQVDRLLQKMESSERQPTPAVLDPKDVESFGADLVEMVRRQASGEIQAAITQALANVTGRLDQLEARVTGVNQSVALTAEQSFYATLTGRKANWKAINENPKFLAWLGEVDGVYGEARQAALDRASAALDVDRVVAIFDAFEKTAVAPAPSQAAELQAQVAPPVGGNSAPPTQTAPQMIRAQDVQRFYDDVRRGKFRGREAEMAQIEAAINSAMAQGRVI